MQLGDAVEKALSHLGITEEKVSKWLGRPCGCRERKRRLNALGGWLRSHFGARRMRPKADEVQQPQDPEAAKKALEEIVGDE